MDNHTPEQRHKNMTAVKSKGTKIEVLLQKELWHRGLRYRKNVKNIYGKPDIAFIGKKIAVFCDSEFFHGFDWEIRSKEIKSNREFWIPKIEKNIQRDKDVTDKLKKDGWIVLRFWGNEIKNDVSGCADKIESVIRSK
ncbi:MAG: very short patch repair endonuclease [Ruminococcus sp.]|nr:MULTISPECIES: very short patch repair endonuclease [Ruminococcus]